MGNIVLLDELTINKIAAGEVIERPASVVKELVENSIDAGANKITIETKNGGITYIRITDNGKGFLPDDMEIAFERHATSKIREASDLENVTSMGFRGEALASIAAISHVELISKTENNDIGKKIEVKGGNILNLEDAGCSKGTTITVTDLFYNTPVRYKFLKKDFTEAGYIEDVVTRIALIHPEISIKLINSGKVIIQTSGNGDKKSVIYSIYGKDVAQNVINVDYTYEDIHITGVIGKPVIARSNRSNQLFFVNKRYIKDKILTSAAEQGYKGLLTIGKYGFLVLNIEMNPKKVDVNVHPAKLEVRFEDESTVFKAIYHAIKDSLLKEDLIPDKTKIELDKQSKQDKWKIDTGFVPSIKQNQSMINNTRYKITNDNTNSSTNENIGRDEPKIDILAEINKMKNVPIPNIDELGKTSDEIVAESINNKDIQDDKLEDKVEDANISDKIAEKENKIEENENQENQKEHIKHNSIFNIFSSRKRENDDDENKGKDNNDLDNIDDTQNFIVQIYNHKNGLEVDKEKSSEEFETKKITLTDINEEMKKLDELKIEPEHQDFDEMYAKTFGRIKKEEPKIEEEDEEYKVDDKDLKTVENVSIFEKLPENKMPEYKFIGIAFSTYIIIEMNNELYIIDQHAAHERIMYEKVKENYYSNTNKDSQLMLLPDIINLSHKDMQIAKDNMKIFEKAGFVLEEFGENTIKLSGVPTICLDLDTKELFLETLDEINTVARTAKQEIEERFLATIACKAAVKANMALTREEVDNLMSKLLTLPNPFTCPHGRPTAIRMTKNDIEKKFSRR